MKSRKNALLTILMLFFVVVLGVVSYFVSQRLAGTGPVAPNAPGSKPKADAGVCAPCDTNSRCSTGFECMTATGKTSGICVKKGPDGRPILFSSATSDAYDCQKFVSKDCAGTFAIACPDDQKDKRTSCGLSYLAAGSSVRTEETNVTSCTCSDNFGRICADKVSSFKLSFTDGCGVTGKTESCSCPEADVQCVSVVAKDTDGNILNVVTKNQNFLYEISLGNSVVGGIAPKPILEATLDPQLSYVGVGPTPAKGGCKLDSGTVVCEDNLFTRDTGYKNMYVFEVKVKDSVRSGADITLNTNIDRCERTLTVTTASLELTTTAYLDDVSNSPDNGFNLREEITEVSKGQVFVYSIKIKNNSDIPVSGVEIKDVLTGRGQNLLKVVDIDNRTGATCRKETSTFEQIICNTTVPRDGEISANFRVRVANNATNGTLIKNQVTGKWQNEQILPSENTLTVNSRATCNEVCQSDAQCADGLACDTTSGKCRNPLCVDRLSCGCQVEPTNLACNQTCTANSQCRDGMFCDSASGRCRNEECSDRTNCSCSDSPVAPASLVSCNGSCQSTADCKSGLFCDDNGRCRNENCVDKTNCSCSAGTGGSGTGSSTVTKTPASGVTEQIVTDTNGDGVIDENDQAVSAPTAEVLTDAGVFDTPAVWAFGGGLMLTVLGLLLAL